MTDYLQPGRRRVRYTVDPEGALIPNIREGWLDFDVMYKSTENNKGWAMLYGENHFTLSATALYNLWSGEVVEAGDIIFSAVLDTANDHVVRYIMYCYNTDDINIGQRIVDETENKTLFDQALRMTSVLAWSQVYGSGDVCIGPEFYIFTANGQVPNYLRWSIWDRSMNVSAPGVNDTAYMTFSDFYAENPSSNPDTQLRYDIFDYLARGKDNPYMPPASETKADIGTSGYVDYNIDFPSAPSVTAVSTDLLRLYRMDSTGITNLAAFLWSDNFIQNIKKLYASPMDNIISLNLLPVDITGTATNVVIGNLNTGVAGQQLSGQFLTMDFHSVQIPKMWGNQLDFQPATTCQIFIPYIGYRDLDLDDASGGTVSLKVRLDLLSGDILAMVKITQTDRYYHDSVEYFFDGNCAVNIPLSGSNYGQLYAAYAGAGLGFVASGLTGNVPGAMASIGAGVSSIMTGKPAYQRSGNIGGARGYMGLQKAFILLSSPVPSIPGSITQIRGLRSNIYSQFSQLSGYAEIDDFLPNSTLVSACTEEELQEIKQKLQEGVIF